MVVEGCTLEVVVLYVVVEVRSVVTVDVGVDVATLFMLTGLEPVVVVVPGRLKGVEVDVVGVAVFVVVVLVCVVEVDVVEVAVCVVDVLVRVVEVDVVEVTVFVTDVLVAIEVNAGTSTFRLTPYPQQLKLAMDSALDDVYLALSTDEENPPAYRGQL